MRVSGAAEHADGHTESGLRRRVRGLSEAEFRQRYGTEAQCRAALFQLRWGKGWACPNCDHGGYAELKGRAVYQCNRCKRQVGLTAGTVFHWTKLPLTTWFLAIYHLTQSKGGISSIELGRRLGAKQATAWLVKHKLMRTMAEREAKKPKLQGRVEIDDAYLGGARSGGKRGRGAAGKTSVVAAVETTAERRPRKLKLLPVKGFRKREVEKLAREHTKVSPELPFQRPGLPKLAQLLGEAGYLTPKGHAHWWPAQVQQLLDGRFDSHYKGSAFAP